jgi:ABC-type transporter Mla subunit MlaD
MTTLRTSLSDLQTASDTLDAAMGTNGTRMRQVDQVSDYLSQSAVEMRRCFRKSRTPTWPRPSQC